MTCFSIQQIYNLNIQNLRQVASHYWRKHRVLATNQCAGFYSCSFAMCIPNFCLRFVLPHLDQVPQTEADLQHAAESKGKHFSILNIPWLFTE